MKPHPPHPFPQVPNFFLIEVEGPGGEWGLFYLKKIIFRLDEAPPTPPLPPGA